MIVSGKKVSGRYEIIKQIGQGGMADVYLAFDNILERKVAVKVLRGDMSSDERFVRRFQREALSASSLSHPNIVEMYDVGEDEGKYYIVMEYLDGITLKQLIQKRGSLSVVEVIDIMKQLTNALSHAHEKYIVHRDIKPQNIIILDDGTVKITDFGIALATNQTQLTHTNSVLGSVHYLPPEQASGAQSTSKSDIYSLGVVMYELLSGELPFKGDSAVSIALMQLKEPMPRVKSLVKDIPQSVENIIVRSTAKDPENRYPSVNDMYEDLCTCLDPSRSKERPLTIRYYDEDPEHTKTIPMLDSKAKKKIHEAISFEKEDKKKDRLIPILTSVLAALIIFVLSLVFIIPSITSSKEVKIPDIVGMTEQDAIKALEEAGFIVDTDIKYSYNDDYEDGMVINTYPSIGKSIKKGSPVTIFVSKGSQKITLEDYTNKNALEIKGKLEALGLRVVIEAVPVEEVPDLLSGDIVIRQSPAANTSLLPGETVTLFVPRVDSTYPDMVLEGWSADMVKEFAMRYNLILDIREEYSATVQKGLVISQNRTASSPIISGASLIVTISKGPEPVTPPPGENGNDNNNGTGDIPDDNQPGAGGH